MKNFSRARYEKWEADYWGDLRGATIKKIGTTKSDGWTDLLMLDLLMPDGVRRRVVISDGLIKWDSFVDEP